MRLQALVAGVCLWLAAPPAGAAPPLQRPERVADRSLLRPRASAAMGAAGVDRAEAARAQTTGTYKAVVILLQFTDNRADTLSHTPAAFESLLFSVGTHPTGSMRDYYREVSRGQFDIEGTVTRWYTAPQPYSFYNGGPDPGFGLPPGNAQGMVADAILLADQDIDFSQYDSDGPDGVPNSGDDDGFVDGVFLVHAGPGGEEVAGTAIRSHKWNVPGSGVEVDGVRVSAYTMEPEEFGLTYPGASTGDLISVGVFCHEFGHVLGLPDLYDVTEASAGIGEWDVMGYGVYTHAAGEAPGSKPAHPSAWSKARLGWVTPTWVLQDSAGVTIPPVETSGQVFRLWTNGEEAAEYFLVENRQAIGFDAGLVRASIESGQGPAHGLLIYHVDESMFDNNDAAHKLVDVEEAGGPGGITGVQNLDLPYGSTQVQDVCGSFANVQGNRGDTRDPRPGVAGVTSFQPGSCPSSASVCGSSSQVAIRDIVETAGDIHADFYVNAITLRRLTMSVEDPPGPGLSNDGDGIVEPGETIRIRVPIINTGTIPTGPLVARLESEVFLALDPDSILYPSLSGGAIDSGSVVLATILSAPDPRGGNITMNFFGAPGLVDRDSVQVLVGGRTGICENFETMQRRWTSVALGCNGANDWHREAGVNVTPGGDWAWRLGPFGAIGSYAPSEDARLVSQPIRLEGSSDTLHFYQRYDSEAPFDGLSVDISTDGGETWTMLTPLGGYNNGDRFAGFQPSFVRVDVPLHGYQGLVQIGFRFRSNAHNGGLGFWIDDVTVQGTDECATTAVQVERFECVPDPERRSVRVDWKLDRAVGSSIRIERASAGIPRREIAALPWTAREGTYEDRDVQTGITYSYWLTAELPGEPAITAGPVRVGVTAGAGDAPPRALALSPMVPNPFWGSARFSVSLDRDERFMVRVYRADGSRVRTLADTSGRTQDYPFTWDGTDDRGRPVGTGIYFVELRSGTRVRTQKAVLLR